MQRRPDSGSDREPESRGSRGRGTRPPWQTALLIVAALILTAYMVFCLLEGRYWRALSWACFLVIAALTFIAVDVRRLAARLRRLFLVAALVAMILELHKDADGCVETPYRAAG